MKRPTLGIYGPSGNDKSGVVSYLDLLSKQLARHFQCLRISNVNYMAPSNYDYTLYNIGNNLLHACAFQALKERPGPTIIHEFNCLDYYLSNLTSLQNKEIEFILRGYSTKLAQKFNHQSELFEYFQSHKEYDRYSEDLYIESLYVDNITIGIVHSTDTLAFLEHRYPRNKFKFLPFPVSQIDSSKIIETRLKYKFGSEQVIFGSFGFIGEYKRLEKVIEAWQIFSPTCMHASLLLVGAKQYNLHIPKNFHISHIDYIENSEEFDQLLISVNCGVQLRYPVLGETSATLSKFIAHSLPVITSRTPLFHSASNEKNVTTITPDEYEVHNLVKCFTDLSKKPHAGPSYNYKFSPNLCSDRLVELILMGGPQ